MSLPESQKPARRASPLLPIRWLALAVIAMFGLLLFPVDRPRSATSASKGDAGATAMSDRSVRPAGHVAGPARAATHPTQPVTSPTHAATGSAEQDDFVVVYDGDTEAPPKQAWRGEGDGWTVQLDEAGLVSATRPLRPGDSADAPPELPGELLAQARAYAKANLPTLPRQEFEAHERAKAEQAAALAAEEDRDLAVAAKGEVGAD